MKVPKLMLIAGLLVLAFAALGVFGNFVQWRNAKETTAKILNAQEQWVRRGAGQLNLELEYSVDGRIHKGTAIVAPSHLKDENVNEINVYYMADKPDRVIPMDVLKAKQRDVGIAGVVGAVLIGLGVILNRRKGASDGPGAAPGPS